MRDEIGLTEENSLQTSYAYRINMNKATLSLGLLAGFSRYSVKYSEARVITFDPTQADINETLPNFGAGIFFSATNVYFGLSAPVILKSSIEREGNKVFSQTAHYFLTGGAVLTVNKNLILKPNFLIKAVTGAPLGYNINLNALIQDFLWLGVSLRPPESVNFLIEFQLTKQLRIGYTLDHILEGTLSQAATTSHEFMINYRLRLKNNQVITPRYF